MEPRIEELKPKMLIGLSMEMSYADNKTKELWQTFMPRRGEVNNRISSAYISLQRYNESENDIYSPATVFKKWAVVEVSTFSEIPSGMQPYLLHGGKYAVFIHNGPASDFAKTFQYIFADWLPKSDYQLDQREHFEVLPEGYSPVDPNAREEIWIPVKLKAAPGRSSKSF